MPESESYNDDTDSQDEFADSPGESSTGSQGNRPAEGARQVSPGDVLSSAFQGSANAGDFLGLDEEVGEEPTASGGLELKTVDPYGDEEAVDDDFDEYAEDDDEFEEEDFEEEQAELDEEYAVAEPEKSKLGLYTVGAFAVGLLAVAGVVLGPKYLKKDNGTVEVATTTSTTTPKPPVTTGSDPTTITTPETNEGDPLITDPEIDLTTGGEVPFFPEGTGTVDTDPVIAVNTAEDGAPEGGSVLSFDFIKALTGGNDEGETSGPTSQLPGFGNMQQLDTASFDPSMFSSEAWMTGDVVDMIWRDTMVPMEAIAHPARIMTPRVGQVRAHLKDGEVFEGRLYAVGQNRVWIESDLGRLGLDGELVLKLERVFQDIVANGSTFDSTSLGSGKRVRVQVPGGVIYGRVLSVVDEQVTLMTDAGARLILSAPDIEPMGPSRAILVER